MIKHNRVEEAKKTLEEKENGGYLASFYGLKEDAEKLREAVASMPHLKLYSQDVHHLLQDLTVPEGTPAEKMAVCAAATEALSLGGRYIHTVSGWARRCVYNELTAITNQVRQARLDELGCKVAEVTLPLYTVTRDGHRIEKKIVFLVDPEKEKQILQEIADASKAGDEVTANRVAPCLGDDGPGVKVALGSRRGWHEHAASGGDEYTKGGTRGLVNSSWVLGIKEIPEESRKFISCFKGLAPVSMPADWLVGFDAEQAFAVVGKEARIRFPNDKAFGVTVHHAGANVSREVRLLSEAEMAKTSWGGFTSPWEGYQTAKIFGHGPVTALDQVG